MSRKPLQITSAPNGNLYCLCDDGTIWVRPFNYENVWLPVVPIPQPPQAVGS